MTLEIQRLASFCEGNKGGNPAGVVITAAFPTDNEMQRIAAEIGYSETVFAIPADKGWRVRYFSPKAEVPFCGHATIALGAALAQKHGDGVFPLTLNDAEITVQGHHSHGVLNAALQSPPTRSKPAPQNLTEDVMRLFRYTDADLNSDLPPALIHAGADHFVLALNSREALARMRYDLEAGRNLMLREQWITILLIHATDKRVFHCRNAFTSGGVYEDPATGAAAAAFAAYLRDINWPHGGSIELFQGQDMGMPSHIVAKIPSLPGSSIKVSGCTRPIDLV